MRVGVTLPQFRTDPGPALDAAARAEALGLDGVFVFDHLWPLGDPDGLVLHGTTLLGALAAATTRLTVGTLVARVGLVADAVLVRAIATAAAVAGGRLVAGLGVGDHLSRAENAAAGVAYPPLAERLGGLARCVEGLRRLGVRTWVGGPSPALRRAAAAADGWNGWDVAVEEVAAAAEELAGPDTGGRAFEVTWGGQVLVARSSPVVAAALDERRRAGGSPPWSGTPADLRRHLAALEAAGAAWAICAPVAVEGWPAALEAIAEGANR